MDSNAKGTLKHIDRILDGLQKEDSSKYYYFLQSDSDDPNRIEVIKELKEMKEWFREFYEEHVW